MMLFGHQTQLFMGQKPDATDPHGKINKDLKVALNLKWEKCDSTVDTIEKWGRASDAPKGWNPRF
jgi:hypothetical protein